MSRRDPMVSIQHMRDHALEAVQMVQGHSRPDLDADRMLNLALTRLLEIIGEASNRVPDGFRSIHPQVSWRQTVDLRNRLIHGYYTIDFDTLWEIVRDELPALIDQMELIIRDTG